MPCLIHNSIFLKSRMKWIYSSFSYDFSVKVNCADKEKDIKLISRGSNWLLASNFKFSILISLQPNGWRLLNLEKFMVWILQSSASKTPCRRPDFQTYFHLLQLFSNLWYIIVFNDRKKHARLLYLKVVYNTILKMNMEVWIYHIFYCIYIKKKRIKNLPIKYTILSLSHSPSLSLSLESLSLSVFFA